MLWLFMVTFAAAAQPSGILHPLTREMGRLVHGQDEVTYESANQACSLTLHLYPKSGENEVTLILQEGRKIIHLFWRDRWGDLQTSHLVGIHRYNITPEFFEISTRGYEKKGFHRLRLRVEYAANGEPILAQAEEVLAGSRVLVSCPLSIRAVSNHGEDINVAQ